MNKFTQPMDPAEINVMLEPSRGYVLPDVPERAENALRTALGGMSQDQLNDFAISLILPIEEKVRRESPEHPTLAVIDEYRRLGKL